MGAPKYGANCAVCALAKGGRSDRDSGTAQINPPLP